MAKESVFSTPRPQTQSASQMLESKINKRNAQKQNIIALTEANRLGNATPDFTASLEAANQATEQKLQIASTMESAAYAQGSKNIAKSQLGMKKRLVQEGTEYLKQKVLYEMIYEAYWMDDALKDSTANQIAESITDVLGYIDENCDGSKVAESKWSPFLQSMNAVIEATVNKTATRICEEAEKTGDAYSEFELTDAEEDELDNKLTDLGRDDIVDLIKAKVADVIQDEKEKGQERAEMFNEIDELSQVDSTEDQSSEDDTIETTETEESLALKLANGEITMEGANIESLKIYFSKLRSTGSKTLKEANKLFSAGQYSMAAERYKKAKDMFEDLSDRLTDVDDSLLSTVISWSYIAAIVNSFVALVDTINARGFATNGDATKAHNDTSTWNSVKLMCLSNVKKVIRFCDTRIKASERLAAEEAGNPKKYRYALDSTMYTDDDNAEDTFTEAEEAVIAGIRSGEIVTEGASWDTLKIYFSDLRKRASKYCKEANKLYSQGRYDEAAKKYEECKDIFEDLKKRLADVDDSWGSTIISWFTSYITQFVVFNDVINTRGGAATTDIGDAHKDTDTWNNTRLYVIANVNKMIRYCDTRIRFCKDKSNTEKTGKTKDYKYALDSVVYTANERHMASILESEEEVRLFDDPTWGEFKSTISLICKDIKNTLEGPETIGPKSDCECASTKWEAAKYYIEQLERTLSDVPEDVPVDVKEFVMAMVNLIYMAVPSDEVIISRFGNPLGSPDVKSNNPVIDMMTVSWADLLVNIKTNLNSVKGYLDNKMNPEVIDDTDLNNSDCPVTGRAALSQMIARNQSQILARNIGGSLFEAMMIGSLQSCSRAAMESHLDINDDAVSNAALIESILNYTVFETLDTIGLYKFRLNDINKAKRKFMNPVTEADVVASSQGSDMTGDNAMSSGVMNNSGNPMSGGRDSKGLKKVRINVNRMKQKRDVMKSNTPINVERSVNS